MEKQSKKPYFKKNSRMKHYDIIFDESINQNRVAFYKSGLFKGFIKDSQDSTFIIPKGMEYRLDLVSVKFYGTASYDWVLAEVNNIEDPIKDVVAGLKLIIPNRNKLGGI